MEKGSTIIFAGDVFYIKLGKGGEFVEECFNGTPNTVKLDYREINHNLCLHGKWEEVKEDLVKRHNPNAASNHLRQIEIFYKSNEDTIWITFHDNKMWWCKAEAVITADNRNVKSKKVIGKWTYQNIVGEPLLFGNLSGKLLTTKAYRATICSVEADYVLRKINNQNSVEALKIKTLISDLQIEVAGMIQKLYWNDLELFVDLVFRQSGWRRVSYLGKQEQTIDLDLESTITKERGVVQVKAKSNLGEFIDYEQKLKSFRSDYHKIFFVCPQPKDDLLNHIPATGTVLYFSDKLAELAISAGLVDWLIKKCG